MGGALADSQIFSFFKQPEIAFLWIIYQKVWLDAIFLSIRGGLSCYQQSHLFESRIPAEALPTLIHSSIPDETQKNTSWALRV